MVDVTYDPFKKIVNEIILGIVIVCFIGGIILNALFLKRNKGFTKEKEKVSDVKLFYSLLAIFNILHLLDIIPFCFFIINSGISNYHYVFCKFNYYYSQITMFGIIYCVITCCRDCFILSLNNTKYKYSNRFQMIIEALTIWATFLTLIFTIDFLGDIFDRNCFKTQNTLISETVVIIISFLLLIFTALTYCKVRHLTLQDSLTMHVIIQTRKISFMYFIFWFPSNAMNNFTGHLSFNGTRSTFHEREAYFFRIFSYALEYAPAVIFPLLCKIRKNVTVEHELL
ncbi:UNVERIFIED_CONTAM: hypothetical protein RMT77_005642 [Armadillidium vulgare]